MNVLLSFATMQVIAGYNEDPGKVSPLLPGSEVPSAEILSTTGESLNTQDILQEGLSLVIFYRGGWCPYCNRHFQEIAEVESSLKALGYRIIGISPDRFDSLPDYATDQSLSYDLYSDSSANAMKAFGLAFRVSDSVNERLKGYDIDLAKSSGEDHQLLPVPAVFLVKDGKILYTYANPDHRTRLSGKVILAAAEFVKNQ